MIIDLSKGWGVLQDIHCLGERYQIMNYDFDQTMFGLPNMKAMPPWQPLDRLEHLQLSLAQNPYYGFELRQFNAAPWWYRNVFDADGPTEFATLTFMGVDYFCDVWLNEVYLGSHEGYNTPFSFEVGGILKEKDNLLIVKVSAPLEQKIVEGQENDRFLFLIRDQLKGTYEHSDTFLPRDANPVGIWNRVELTLHEGVTLAEPPYVPYELAEDYSKATVRPEFRLKSQIEGKAQYRLKLYLEGDPKPAAAVNGSIVLKKGENLLTDQLVLSDPKLWTVWERGRAWRYRAELELVRDGRELLRATRRFGLRRIEIKRDEIEVYFKLNGEKIYLRGCTYFPDVYVSANDCDRFRRDIANAKQCGVNAWRIHVHTEREEFYDLVDEAGILLIQDSDFNWTHPTDEAWTERAVGVFGSVIRMLRDHPSIFCWVLLNEPRLDSYTTVRPGPQFRELVQTLVPGAPYIMSSWAINDPESGDSHNYEGSLHGSHTHYTNIFGQLEKLNSEFGMDAPPVFSTLRKDPELVKILGPVVDGIDVIHEYQYRYLKYFIEHYRLQKFAPCGGHFQFLFTDTAPSSHFGVYDRTGLPKAGQRAFLESNQPVAIMMDASRTAPVAVWAVNDLLKDFGGLRAEILAWTDEEEIVFEKECAVGLGPNSRVKVSDLDFTVDPEKNYTVRLRLLDGDGNIVAENRYEKAFRHPDHVAGHPYQLHHGVALRVYWAWLKDKK